MRDALHDLLKYQRRLGLTTVDTEDQNGNCCKLRPNWGTFFQFWLLQGVVVFTCRVFIIFWDHKFEATHTGVANHFAHVLEVLEPLSISWLLVWMRLHEGRQVRLLNRLQEMARVCHQVVTIPRWLLRLWLISSVGIVLSCLLYACTLTGLELVSLVPYGTFILRHTYYNYLITFFTAIIFGMEQILMAHRRRIERSLRSNNKRELARSLCAIDEIHLLCETDINYIFGGSLALQMLYIVLSTASFGYILSLEWFELLTCGAIVLCIFPTMFYSAMPAWSIRLQVENQSSVVSWSCQRLATLLLPFFSRTGMQDTQMSHLIEVQRLSRGTCSLLAAHLLATFSF
ncbi:GL26656 [Drosophila persimilis]|uniref:GL26656 n=1 Tax=Drosophila persimilis TaxID=7234 RepID=B4GT46_DROPE|nr:GL26656 [Drosophila persimilis]